MSDRPTTEPHVHVIPLGYGDHEANEGETYSLVQCRECLEMLAIAPGRRALAEAAQGAAARAEGRAVQDDGLPDLRMDWPCSATREAPGWCVPHDSHWLAEEGTCKRIRLARITNDALAASPLNASGDER